MRQNEGMRSVHFPGVPKPNTTPAPEPAKGINILEVFANAHRDTELIREKLRGLLTSENRHGDLQACLSAVKRLADELGILIEHEE